MKIGFALITAPPIFEKIVEIENALHNTVNFHNKLELVNNIPHTTLFQGTFRDDTNYITIAETIADYYKTKCADHCLHFESVKYIPQGWYFYTCKITNELKALHEVTLSNSKEYILLDPQRLNRNISGLTKAQIKGITDYGYRYSADAFFPHITLGRTSENMRAQIISLFSNELDKIEKDVPIGKLTVYEMGVDGMHAKTLYEIPFK